MFNDRDEYSKKMRYDNEKDSKKVRTGKA
jgi:hypothetical protein